MTEAKSLQHLCIRDLAADDCPPLSGAFEEQGWASRLSQLQGYVSAARAGKVDALIAEWAGERAGYVTVRRRSSYPPFREAGIPEIADLNVLEKFQRRGIATALLQECENRVVRVAQVIGIGVGLTADYGKAQRLYVNRGYVPDGRGISRNEHFPQWGENVRVDDDLILALTKRLAP